MTDLPERPKNSPNHVCGIGLGKLVLKFEIRKSIALPLRRHFFEPNEREKCPFIAKMVLI
jgi:hypothetical protein